MTDMTANQVQGTLRERLATTRMLRTILIVEFIGVAGLAISDEITYQSLRTAYAAAPLLIGLLVCLWLVGRGILYPAQIVIPLGPLLVRDYLAFEGVGLHDISVIAFPAIIILAYLTLNKTLSIVFSGLTIISTSLLGLGEMNGVFVNAYSKTTTLDDIIISAILLASISAITYIIIERLNENILLANRNEQAQIKANKIIEEERANLEARVKERTQALERRAVQLRAAADVGNAAASLRDLDTLLDQAAYLLSNRFGFYHTGVFLLDETGKFAVLRATNSEGGKRMLRRGHKLEVGQVGIVGYVAERSQARIALDVGADAVFFDNPDLPTTRSEMALPLRAAGRVLGVLDIQSTEPLAFTDADIETLQIVADQLAISIENSYLLAESQAAVETTRRAFGEIAVKAWKGLLARETNLGFVSTGRETRPLLVANEGQSPESLEAVSQNHPVTSKDRVVLFAPVAIRGQSIGVLRLVKPGQEIWTDDEIQIVQSLSDQLTGALESARLYETAQKRAAKEHTIDEISTRIGASASVESILRLAVQELGKVIEGSDVTIQLEPPGLRQVSK